MNIGPLKSNDPREIERWVLSMQNRPVRVPVYTVSTLPPAEDWIDCIAGCSDETGGNTIVKSNGTNWQRVSDGATAS